MDQMPFLEVLRRRVWLIVAVCIIATAAGYSLSYVSFLLPEQYTASALVLVRPQHPIRLDTTKPEKEAMDFPMGTSSSVETPSKTYIEIIKSPELVGKVVRQLGLDQEKEPDNAIKKIFKDIIAIAKYGQVIQDDPFTRSVKTVQENLTLKSREDTYLFEITYKGDDPKTAADIVNALTKLFRDYMEEMRLSEAQFVRNHLKTQVEQSRKTLDRANDRVKKFKEEHSIFLTETEYTSRLKIIADLEVELAKAQAALKGNQGTLMNANLAARSARLARSLQEQEAERGQLPAIERQLKQLDMDAGVAMTAYKVIDKEYQEAEIKHSYPMPEIRLVSPAVPPRLPSGPARLIIALASLLAGLVVGIGLANLLEYVNRQVRGVDDVEGLVGVKVLATVPRVPQGGWRGADI